MDSFWMLILLFFCFRVVSLLEHIVNQGHAREAREFDDDDDVDAVFD